MKKTAKQRRKKSLKVRIATLEERFVAVVSLPLDVISFSTGAMRLDMVERFNQLDKRLTIELTAVHEKLNCIMEKLGIQLLNESKHITWTNSSKGMAAEKKKGHHE